MVDIVGRRYWFYLLSLLVIAPGLIALAVWGLPLSIDFTGGSLLEVRFEQTAQPVEAARVRQAYVEHGHTDLTVQTSGTQTVVVRSKPLIEAEQSTILASLEAIYGPATVQAAETVGPTVGAEVAQRATLAVALAAVAVVGYITYAFRRVEHPVRFGVAAIVALVHDVLVILGFGALLGHFLGWEIDALFLTAMLTVVGFSVHDTIVIFDRIRENLLTHRRLPYATVVNHSVIQSVSRSLNTQLTVLFTLLALALFGGETIRHFVIVLIVGLLAGTYSSIFIGAPLLVIWENREWAHLFGRRKHAHA
jgi:preprotein translocase subunit SecF